MEASQHPKRAGVGRLKKLKLLLVDDHPLVRAGIRAALEREEGITVVGEASDGAEALALARQLRPDLVLMDIRMPRINGVEATRAMTQENPSLKVVMLSVHENKEYVMEALQSGAQGYLLKDSAPKDLVCAIEAVRIGRDFFSPEVSRMLASEFVRVTRKPPVPRSAGLLSHREETVLALIARGKTNKDVAAELGIGLRTVETYRERMLRKLGLKNTADLTRHAISRGIIEL